MTPVVPILLAFGLALIGWLVARGRAHALRSEAAASGGHLASLPQYYGWYVALWIAIPALLFAGLWSLISPGLILSRVLAEPAAANLPAFGFERDSILAEAQAIALGKMQAGFNPASQPFVEPFREALHYFGMIGLVGTLLLAIAGGGFAFMRVRADFGARGRVERIAMGVLLLASLVAIFTTFGILASLAVESLRFFSMVNPIDFLFGTHWAPDPMSSPQLGLKTNYGAVPLFWGTIYIGAIIAMIVAIPLGLMSAIYLTQYASPRLRRWIKPLLEILAGVPTVVYGYFAALTVAPMVRTAAQALGISNASSESALAAGLVMGIMIIPLVSSMADDSIAAVPEAMRDGSLAMGATNSETIRRVLIPAALPGIVAGIMLAVSRAIGETMIVVMAAGRTAHLSSNPFDSMTTVTAQIVALLTSDGTPDHPATLSAYALGFVLFLVTLTLNFIALYVVKRFREAYE